jgi:hypothetical protein
VRVAIAGSEKLNKIEKVDRRDRSKAIKWKPFFVSGTVLTSYNSNEGSKS